MNPTSKRNFLPARSVALLALLAAGALQAQPALPVTGRIDFGPGMVFSAAGASSVTLSEQLVLTNPFDPTGRPGRAFGSVSADLVGGAIRGEQAISIPWLRGRTAEVAGRVSPLLTIQPEPGVAPGVIQVPLDLVINGSFEIPSFLFGSTGDARNRFAAGLQMRNVSSNSSTLVEARYTYAWNAASNDTGVTESYSHVPFTFVTPFAPPGSFNAGVTPDDPLDAEFRHGFKDIRLHIDFPYFAGSGTLIQLTTDVVSSSSAQNGGAAGNWVNSAILDLDLPTGYFLADANGNRLVLNWDGTGGNGISTPIPEPETWLLLSTGFAALLAFNRRRPRRAA